MRPVTVTAALCLLVATALAACSPGATDTPRPVTTASHEDVTPGVLTAPVTTEALLDAGLLEKATIDRTANAEFGVVASQETVIDSYGRYTRLGLSDDAPILQFDPAGEWGWLTEKFDPAYVAQVLKTAATYLVEDWVDSPTRWDDSKRAWDEFGGDMNTLLGGPVLEPRAVLAGSEGAYLDIGDWRQGLGLRPEPYVDEQVRVAVTRLEVDDMYYLGNDAGDATGLEVSLVMAFDEVVVRTDGERFVMKQEVILTFRSAWPDGGIAKLLMGGAVSVGRRVDGGVEVIPLQEIDPGVPDGWQPIQVGQLSFALPPEVDTSETSVTAGWTEYTLGEPTAPDSGEPQTFRVHGPTEGSEQPGWFAEDGFSSSRFEVPGATSVVARHGKDTDGRYRVRLSVHAMQDGAPVEYQIEFDSTAETAAEELTRYVATMSVAAG